MEAPPGYTRKAYAGGPFFSPSNTYSKIESSATLTDKHFLRNLSYDNVHHTSSTYSHQWNYNVPITQWQSLEGMATVKSARQAGPFRPLTARERGWQYAESLRARERGGSLGRSREMLRQYLEEHSPPATRSRDDMERPAPEESAEAGPVDVENVATGQQDDGASTGSRMSGGSREPYAIPVVSRGSYEYFSRVTTHS